MWGLRRGIGEVVVHTQRGWSRALQDTLCWKWIWHSGLCSQSMWWQELGRAVRLLQQDTSAPFSSNWRKKECLLFNCNIIALFYYCSRMCVIAKTLIHRFLIIIYTQLRMCGVWDWTFVPGWLHCSNAQISNFTYWEWGIIYNYQKSVNKIGTEQVVSSYNRHWKIVYEPFVTPSSTFMLVTQCCRGSRSLNQRWGLGLVTN